MSMPPGQMVVSPLMVGRAGQLHRLSTLVEQAHDGAGQAVLVSGEAGIGKSRLVSEARAAARDRDVQILQGNCFETDRSLPYAPLLDMLRTSLGLVRSGEPGPEWVAAAPEIIKILPELSAYLPGIMPTPPLEPEQEKRRLFESLTRFLLDSAARRPLLVIIEDLHWCDDTSLEWMVHLARRCTTQPVLILLTYRSDEINPALAHFLAEIDRQRLGSEISLNSLTTHDVSDMLTAIFRLSRPARAEFVQAIYTLTEGNPFFIEEVLKALVVEGDIFFTGTTWDRKPLHDLRIPRSVHDAVRRRSANLSGPAREILKTASVAGQRFAFTLVRALTGLDEPRLLELIRELIDSQLVVEASAEQFAFRHALTRQAVYSDLLARERRTLHRRIAETTEGLYADLLEPHIPDLAYHFYEAEEWDRALHYAQRAGEKARALDSPGAAVEHFTRAIEATARISAEPPLSLYRERGLAYETLGNFDLARADHESALSIARAAVDPKAEWRSLMDLGLLWSGRDYSQAGDFFEQALELARHISDMPAVAHSLNRVANWNVNLERPNLALQYHLEALSIFQSLGDQAGTASTLDLLGMASGLSGDLERSVAYYRKAIDLFRQVGDRNGLASSLAVLVAWSGSYHIEIALPGIDKGEAIRANEEARRLSSDIGWRAGEAFALISRGDSLAPAGHYKQALEAGHQGLQIAESIEHKQWMTYANFSLGQIFFDLLAFDRARAHLSEALRLALEVGSLHWRFCAAGVLASLSVVQGDPAAAEATLSEVLNEGTPCETSGQRFAWCAAVEVALARGRVETAWSTLDRLNGSVPGIEAHGPRTIPRLAILQGEALEATSRRKEAEERFLSALEAAQAQGYVHRQWRAHALLSRLYAMENRTVEAARHTRRAREIVARIAAELPDDSLGEQFAARASDIIEGNSPGMDPAGRTGQPHKATRRAPGGLTAREAQISALLARGRSNKQIAETLVLTERTVETHVSNILAKLGFTSRSQIAVWSVENSLSPAHGSDAD